MSKSLIFYLFFIFFINSCQIGLKGSSSVLTSNIRIIPVPYGLGGRFRATTGKPAIFLQGGEKFCRPRPFNIYDAREALDFEGLEQEFLDYLFGVEEEENQEDTVSTDRAVTTSVGDNWLKFGLFIGNDNRPPNNYFLMIDSLTYVATAVYKEEFFEHRGNIDSSYCGSEGGAVPYLYLIPPGGKVEYEPLDSSSFDNLTIFISGFPIIDRSGEASVRQQRGGQNIGNANQGAAGIGQEEIIIPDYTVELVLRGQFITKSGEPVASFVKRVRFFTQSSFKTF